MPVYIAIPLRTDSQPLRAAVEKTIAHESRYELQADSGWLIHFSGTTIELTNHLGITGQDPGDQSPVGSAIVIPITNYYGRGPTDMWEWLKIRMEI
jgi:hypothetical protein